MCTDVVTERLGLAWQSNETPGGSRGSSMKPPQAVSTWGFRQVVRTKASRSKYSREAENFGSLCSSLRSHTASPLPYCIGWNSHKGPPVSRGEDIDPTCQLNVSFFVVGSKF